MRIALHHATLPCRTNLIAAPLSPSDEKLLVRGKSLKRGLWVLLLGFLKR